MFLRIQLIELINAIFGIQQVKNGPLLGLNFRDMQHQMLFLKYLN